MSTSKAKGILYFDPDTDLVSEGCQPTKDIVEAIRNHPLFARVTNISIKQKQVNKREIFGRLNDNISTLVRTEEPQKLHQD